MRLDKVFPFESDRPSIPQASDFCLIKREVKPTRMWTLSAAVRLHSDATSLNLPSAELIEIFYKRDCKNSLLQHRLDIFRPHIPIFRAYPRTRARHRRQDLPLQSIFCFFLCMRHKLGFRLCPSSSLLCQNAKLPSRCVFVLCIPRQVAASAKKDDNGQRLDKR